MARKMLCITMASFSCHCPILTPPHQLAVINHSPFHLALHHPLLTISVTLLSTPLANHFTLTLATALKLTSILTLITLHSPSSTLTYYCDSSFSFRTNDVYFLLRPVWGNMGPHPYNRQQRLPGTPICAYEPPSAPRGCPSGLVGNLEISSHY